MKINLLVFTSSVYCIPFILHGRFSNPANPGRSHNHYFNCPYLLLKPIWSLDGGEGFACCPFTVFLALFVKSSVAHSVNSVLEVKISKSPRELKS